MYLIKMTTVEDITNGVDAINVSVKEKQIPKRNIVEVSEHVVSVRATKDHARFYSSNKEQTEWFVSLSNTGILYLSRDKGRTYYTLGRNAIKMPSIRFNDKELKITMINTNKLIFFEKSDYEEMKSMFKLFYP